MNVGLLQESDSPIDERETRPGWEAPQLGASRGVDSVIWQTVGYSDSVIYIRSHFSAEPPHD